MDEFWRFLASQFLCISSRYDGMVCSALDFLSAICVRSQYKDMFKADGVLKTLAGQFACDSQITVALRNSTVVLGCSIGYSGLP